MAGAARSIAGLISLSGGNAQALKALCDLISRIKHSSAEIRRVHNELRLLEGLSSEIQNFCRDHEAARLLMPQLDMLKQCMDSCQAEIKRLRLIFQQPLTPPINAFSRFGKKLKFVYDEHAISQCSLNLGRIHQMVVTALSILGRRNDIHLRNAVKSMDQHLLQFHQKTASFQASLKSQLQASSSQMEGSLKKIHKQMENATSTRKDFETSVRTMLERGETRTCQYLQHSTKELSSLRESSSNIAHQINVLTDQYARLTVRSDLILGGKLDFEGSYLDLAASLGIMKRGLGKFVEQCMRKRCENFRKEDVYWLESEIRKLFGIFDSPGRGRRSISQCPQEGSSSERTQYMAGPKIPHQRVSRGSGIRSHRLVACLGTGHVAVLFKSTQRPEPFHASNHDSKATVSFIPDPDIVQTGFLVEFSTVYRPSPGIYPTLTTFNIIPFDSDAFRFVTTGDVDGMLNLFRDGQVTPSDRDERGRSLLELAVSHYHPDMFQLLRRQGATLQNSVTPERPAVTWMTVCNGFFKDDRNCDIFQWCLATVEDANEHFESYPNLFCHFSAFCASLLSEARDRPYLLHYLNEHLEPDTKSKNKAGRSTLLQQLVERATDTFVVTEHLLQRGADPFTTDYEGNGVFHAILGPTEDRCSERDDESDHEGDEDELYVLTPFHATSTIVQLCSLFIQKGCDPSCNNYLGYTPSDLALWDPHIWFVWCKVLEDSNIDIAELLTLEDEKKNLPRPIYRHDFNFDIFNYTKEDYHGTDQEDQREIVFRIEDLLLGYGCGRKFPFNAWACRFVRLEYEHDSYIMSYLVPNVRNADQVAEDLDEEIPQVWTVGEFVQIKNADIKSQSPEQSGGQGSTHWMNFSHRKWIAFQFYQQVRQQLDNLDIHLREKCMLFGRDKTTCNKCAAECK